MSSAQGRDLAPGIMVGASPFKNPATTSVPTYMVPLIFHTPWVPLRSMAILPMPPLANTRWRPG